MKLLIKFPTRARSMKFFKVLDIYYSLLEDLDNTFFLITCDDDDLTMNNKTVKDMLSGYKNLKVIYDKSKSKIDAVNRDMNLAPEYDIILLASDDMIPQIKGYDNIIREDMEDNFPDTDGVLWYNDGFQKDKLNTLCILGKKYYERFNYIYYPEYKSTWSDNEFMDVANLLGRQVYFDDIIIKHEHPDWGFGSSDVIHNENVKNVSWDRQLFLNRKKIKFGL